MCFSILDPVLRGCLGVARGCFGGAWRLLGGCLGVAFGCLGVAWGAWECLEPIKRRISTLSHTHKQIDFIAC